MQPKRPIWFLMVVVALALFFMLGGVDVMARGGGGGGGGPGGGGGRGGGPGGGHSVGVRGGPSGSYRMQRVYDGPAGGGAFSSQPAPKPQSAPAFRSHTRPETGTRPQAESQTSTSRQQPAVAAPESATSGQSRRPDNRKEMEYQDENYWDQWHYRRHRVALGTIYTEDEFREMRCQSPTVVDGVNYYNCEGVWHRRAYSGGRVIYTVVEAPRSQ